MRTLLIAPSKQHLRTRTIRSNTVNMSREVESGESRNIETGSRNGDDCELSWNMKDKNDVGSVSCELLQAPLY